MTQKQIDAAKATLPRRFDYQTWTDEQKQLDEELSCREMINSCLCYGNINDFWRVFEDFFGKHSYADPYLKSFGRKRVEEIAEEQIADFQQATVAYTVYTDDEGLTYNSIHWADEELGACK